MIKILENFQGGGILLAMAVVFPLAVRLVVGIARRVPSNLQKPLGGISDENRAAQAEKKKEMATV